MAKSLSSLSKVIGAEEFENIERWQIPAMGAADGHPDETLEQLHAASVMTAKQMEGIQNEAYEEGLQRGRKEGLEQGRVQVNALLTELSKPLEQLDAEVIDQLTVLATTIARQLVRRELHIDPGEVIAVVRETVALLPVSTRKVRVHLHPDDAVRVREIITLSEDEEGWKIIEDPLMTRGGCQVLTEASRIDASIEARLNAIIAQAFGDERKGSNDG
ncbi:MAG: flagellar assembly protein FliH [Gammaproteobacteria bacterium]|nr:MAG: flagellar assembly protein FliH [Gammaproteobacteria bacterium]